MAESQPPSVHQPPSGTADAHAIVSMNLLDPVAGALAFIEKYQQNRGCPLTMKACLLRLSAQGYTNITKEFITTHFRVESGVVGPRRAWAPITLPDEPLTFRQLHRLSEDHIGVSQLIKQLSAEGADNATLESAVRKLLASPDACAAATSTKWPVEEMGRNSEMPSMIPRMREWRRDICWKI